MEPKIVNEYSSEKWFRLYDVWGARCLLFRSESSMFERKNVDLIFIGTRYIELPTDLCGLRIRKPKDEQAIMCERRFADDLLLDECNGDFVYRIESEGERYHIIASGIWVQVNTLPDEESPLRLLFEGDDDGSRGYYEQYVEEWQKVE
jgi:hypothetical protein